MILLPLLVATSTAASLEEASGRYGVYPSALVESGFGLNAGVRAMHQDLFGHGDTVAAGFGFGGRLKQRYHARFHTGRLFGDRFRLSLEGGYTVIPKLSFFGIGNRSVLVDPPPRLSRRTWYAEVGAHTELTGDLSAELTAGLRRSSFGPPDDPTSTSADDPMISDFEAVATGAALTFDDRRAANRYVPGALRSDGVRLRLTGGAELGGSIATPFLHYGVDLLASKSIFAGDRVFTIRGALEGVTGALDRVPTVDLPELGGPTLLRGFRRDRFRDRVSFLTSAEYAWPLTHGLRAYCFVDAGRVFPRLADFELEDFHVGTGGGFELYGARSALVRAQLAGSSEGVLFSLAFSPT